MQDLLSEKEAIKSFVRADARRLVPLHVHRSPIDSEMRHTCTIERACDVYPQYNRWVDGCERLTAQEGQMKDYGRQYRRLREATDSAVLRRQRRVH